MAPYKIKTNGFLIKIVGSAESWVSKIEKTWQDGQFDIHQNIKPEYDIGSDVCTYGIHLI
jgi:hypothetical protein